MKEDRSTDRSRRCPAWPRSRGEDDPDARDYPKLYNFLDELARRDVKQQPQPYWTPTDLLAVSVGTSLPAAPVS